jgi:ABC-2 type transport system permease protein
VRSQAAYRTSFVVDLLGSCLVAGADLAEVLVVFANVPTLGGLDLDAALLVFGLAHVSFALANALAGALDRMSEHIRTGSLDVLLLRPQPLLAQLLTGEVVLKRLGSCGVAAVVLAVAIARCDATWTPATVALLVVTPLAGAGVFAALFVVAGAVQFWLVEAAQVTHSFTYASSYAASFSSGVLPLPLRLLFAFVVPAAFTAYLPAIAILGLPGPPGVPAWLGWFCPVAALLAWAAALGLWSAGVRHYTGAGG